MSLLSQALLMIAVRAIAGRTAALQNVFEQPIDPITDVMRRSEGQAKPSIAVYVQSSEGSPLGLETQSGPTETVLKVVAYTPPSWTFISEDEVRLDISNEGVGLGLNLLARQVDAALHYGNPLWVGLLRKFAKHIDQRKTQYILIEVEDGVRIPAIEIAYTVVVAVREPEFGRPLYGHWVAFDAALRGSGEAIVADLIKGLIEMPESLQPYAQYQLALNLSDAAFRATGEAPLFVEGGFVVDTGTGALPSLDDIDASVDEIETVVPVFTP